MRAYVYREFSYQLVADRLDTPEDVRRFVYENASVLKARKAWPGSKETVIYSNPWYYLERGEAFCDQLDVVMGTILAKKGIESFIAWYIDKETGVSPHSVLMVLEREGGRNIYDPLVEEGLLLPPENYYFRRALGFAPNWTNAFARFVPHYFIYLYQDFYLWMLGPRVPSITEATKHYGPPAAESSPELLLYYKARNYYLYEREARFDYHAGLLMNYMPGSENGVAYRAHVMMPREGW